MPLPVRSIAVSIAVIFFFGLSLVGCISGLPPFTCCKRAIVGAALAYIAATWAVKAINSILINAMITSQINQQKEKDGGGKG
jgi:hypothetical protein